MSTPPPDLAILEELPDRELLRIWSKTMIELRRRGILRSDNTPTGDYAEWIVSKALGLTLENNSQSGFDAVDKAGIRYQIKARRLTSSRTSKQLSALRNLHNDPFDFLIVVIFGPEFEVLECWQIPIEVVREYAVYIPHVNGHRLHARGQLLADSRTMRLHNVEDMFSHEDARGQAT